MIELKNVTKKFRSGDGEVTALSNVSMSVPSGKFASIIGKSGSGKSTLLSILGALERPTSGEIIVDGDNIAEMSDSKQSIYRKNKIGFVFQGYNLIPNLSAIENVMIPMEFAGLSVSERKKRAALLLDEVGLDSAKQNRKPGRLSGGEQQRVAIARALANKPSLILADEPTGNLDSKTGKLIFDLLKDLSKKENTTIIAVTHDLAIAQKTDITFKLRDGKIAK